MTSANLANLAQLDRGLKAEALDGKEFDGFVRNGRVRLADAKNPGLSLEGRFDLTYNAAHALALAALRWHGYRSENRYLVFQCLEHTVGLPPAEWRVLALCHERRNKAEYDGDFEVGAQLMADLMRITESLLRKVAALPKQDAPGRGH